MSTPDTSVFAAAFFEGPGLLGVRLDHPGVRDSVTSFAFNRSADARPGGNKIGCIALVSLAAAGVLFMTLPHIPGCSSTSRNRPTIESSMETDCSGGSGWNGTLTQLADQLAPTRLDLHPWMVRTLLDVPTELARRGAAHGGWLKPRASAADQTAHRQAVDLLMMLKAANAEAGTALVLDVPGPQAVAAAAALATRWEPVFTMDNLPHPAEVVPASQTLAATVYWLPQFAQGKRARLDHGSPHHAPPVFVCDGSRLAPYANEVNRFDNRSVVRLPDGETCKMLGIKRILYVVDSSGQGDQDDLNERLCALQEAGIAVRYVALPTVEAQTKRSGGADGAGRWFSTSYGWDGERIVDAEPSDEDARRRPAARVTAFSGRLLDGGARKHDEAISQLTSPPPAPVASSSGSGWGGSNSRSSGWHWS